MPKDRIFLNGNVLTMELQPSHASAFGIVGDRFGAVGSDPDVRRFHSPDADIVDLKGKTVIPGLIETHNHLSDYAMTLLQVDCSTTANRTLSDVLDRIRKKAKETNRNEWIKGWGFDDTLIAEKRHLTRQDLDKASAENPVFIHHISGHLAYVNSRALQMAAIGSTTPDPAGGKIHREETGMPTGLLSEESAQALVLEHIPIPAISSLKKTLQHAINHYQQFGITSVHDGSIGYYRDGPEILRAYRELEAEGKLTMRVYAAIIANLYDSICRMGLGSRFGSEFLKLGSVKLFQDGSIQALTAALKAPYLNRPGFRGHILMPQETLNARVKRYHEAGLQIAIHANGDKAIESVLEALEKACQAYPRQDHRHMIIHCQLASQDHVRRMKRAGVIPSYFINHIYFWGDRHVTEFLGRRRAQTLDPLGSTIKENLLFTLHSDCPVTPVNPFFSIYTAVNRMTREGEVLGETERISVEQALKAFTIHGAYCSFEERIKGSIAPQKLADFVILSDDPLTVHPAAIKNIRVEATVVGGRIVHGGY